MIIGVVGFIGSGKGTVGDILESSFLFKKESFAKPLKDACSSIFGWDRSDLEGVTNWSRKFREEVDPYWSEVLNMPNFSPRVALQLMGTEGGRNIFGENLWTASCIRRCSTGQLNSNYVITDTRFQNEIDAIKKANGIIIRVKRGDDPPWYSVARDGRTYEGWVDYMKQYNQTSVPPIHQSEWDWVNASFDYVVYNTGDENKYVNVLHKQLYDILTDLRMINKPVATMPFNGL